MSHCIGIQPNVTRRMIVVTAAKNPTRKGEFRWRLVAPNGQTIATSEGYSSKESAKKGIESVKKNAPGAAVVEV